MEPFKVVYDLQTGVLHPEGRVNRTHLSQMRQWYADAGAVARILTEEGDRLIYEVQGVDVPQEEGQVSFSTTIIYPGQVGEEFHMTRGHFHAKRDRAEVYLGLAGEGCLLLQTDDGTVRSLAISPGAAVYVPPLWAHRTVNTGSAPLAFFAAWPGDAGHDYQAIEHMGFAKMLVNREGRAVLVARPG